MAERQSPMIIALLLSSVLLCMAQIDVNLSGVEISTKPSLGDVTTEAIDLVIPKNTTTTTTTAATTTTTTTTTTTAKTTKKPDTTTSTTTTTAAPVTTTKPAPTPIPPGPMPVPDPDILTFNSSCILVKMAIQLNFTYETKDNKSVWTLYNIPKSAQVEDANCDPNSTEILQVNWGPNTHQHVMSLLFEKNNVTSNLTMMMFTLPLTKEEYPDAKENQTIQLIHRGRRDFSAPLQMSYHCTRPQTFNLTETIDKTDIAGTVTVRDVQVEAFRGPKATGFSQARDCDGIDTTDIVPIMVGAALASMILIVLISYLCARRRATSRGYMSF